MVRKLLLLFLSFPVLVLPSCGGETSTATFNRINKNQFVTIGSVPFEGPLLYQKSQDWIGPDAELGRCLGVRVIRSPGAYQIGSDRGDLCSTGLRGDQE